MNEPAGEYFPAHMIANPHHRHDGENEAEYPDMDRDAEDQSGDDESAG